MRQLDNPDIYWSSYNLRISQHKVFKGGAKRGKSSTGWFYGFKLHVVINHVGELLAIWVTPGNVDDREPVPGLCRGIFGKLLADKGYISQKLTQTLKEKGIQLLHKVRKNMKSIPLEPFDKMLLDHRSVIETVFDQLKNLCQIEHTRHRSAYNFSVNLMSGIIAYCFQPIKPKMPIYTT